MLGSHNKNYSEKFKIVIFPLFFNPCHRVHIQKNVISRFEKEFTNIDFGPKTGPLTLFWSMIRKFLKNLMKIFSKCSKSSFYGRVFLKNHVHQHLYTSISQVLKKSNVNIKRIVQKS